METADLLSRRHFLRQTAVSTTGFLILNSARSVRAAQANSKINVALVGVTGRGEWFADLIPRLENVVAICDVDEQKVGRAFKRWEELGSRYSESAQPWERSAAQSYQRLIASKPPVFRDIREMLDKAGKGIDAVVVVTPDHTHAVNAAAAMRAGKHVFCEKPLARTVQESRKLRELARQQKVATAMGNQGTYSGPFRRALELIQNGTIGQIKEVHVWNTGGGVNKVAPPQGEQPVPAHLNWDTWVGPARARAYHREWMQWSAWRDFGTCQLGNWGSHTANLGFMALRVHDLWLNPAAGTGPKPLLRVRVQTSGLNRLSFPAWERIEWDIPARGDLPPITIVWYNGAAPGAKEVRNRLVTDPSDKDKSAWEFAGTYIVGTEGAIHTTGHNMWFRLMPEDKFERLQRNRPEIVPASRDPEQDWFAACRGGKPAWSNFDYADALNEFLMLGNVATQSPSGTTLEYDPVAMRIVNDREADARLRCEYRSGWEV